jgi:hypothetical protein
MIREALDLYKRELDIIEANRDRQLAIQAKGYRRIGGWRTYWPLVLAIIAMGALMQIVGKLIGGW